MQQDTSLFLTGCRSTSLDVTGCCWMSLDVIGPLPPKGCHNHCPLSPLPICQLGTTTEKDAQCLTNPTAALMLPATQSTACPHSLPTQGTGVPAPHPCSILFGCEYPWKHQLASTAGPPTDAHIWRCTALRSLGEWRTVSPEPAHVQGRNLSSI